MDDEELFGHVRAVLQITPSEVSFNILTALLGDGDPPREVLDYAAAHIAHWPPNVRREVPHRWIDLLVNRARVPACRLCDSARIDADSHDSMTRYDVDAFLDSEHLSNLKRIDFGMLRDSYFVMKKVVEHPRLAELEELFINDCDLEDFDYDRLAESNHRRLKVLKFSYSWAERGYVSGLVSSAVFGTVTELWIHDDEGGVWSETAQALATSPHVGALRVLDLDAPSFEDDDLATLSKATNLTSLEHLSLRHTKASGPGFLAIADAPFISNLRSLDLSCNTIPSSALTRLAEAVSWERLERVKW